MTCLELIVQPGRMMSVLFREPVAQRTRCERVVTEAGGGGLPARRAGEFAKDRLDNPQANGSGDQLREGSGTQMFLELFEVLSAAE